ncbi:hypothetical protein ACFFIY_10790 [Bhargavaea ullalensis]|uniref:Membrane protein n=1 Tax=Bhargavaea ullalensis TaxID=1265685 RepID=A0ABV2G922_9BACL
MAKKMPFWTAGAVALMTCLGLKFLHYFKFIRWHPAGWTDKIGVKNAAWPIDWALLFAGLFLAALILYFISRMLAKWPSGVTALIIGVAAALLAEWLIFRPDTLSSFKDRLSVPFIVLVLIAVRFVMETAIFHKKRHPDPPK